MLSLFSFYHLFSIFVFIFLNLKPNKGIEYQINLIPSSHIPNRAAYRTSPEETKEIQRQVDKSLQKGVVRESLSPCFVLVILVPKIDMEHDTCVLIVEPSLKSVYSIHILFLDWIIGFMSCMVLVCFIKLI